MAVFRVEHTRDYTVMSNHHLKDKALSLKAKGLLAMMLSFPEEWDYSERGLAAICKEGVGAIRSALKELEAGGYLTRRQLRGGDGRITDTEYTVYEAPCPPETAEPDTEKPQSENPRVERSSAEKAPQLNIYKTTTEILKTDVSRTHSFLSPAGEKDGRADGIRTRKEICDRIEYENLCRIYRPEQVDGLVELMVEVELNRGRIVRLGRDVEYDGDYVRRRFARLGREHVERVLEGINENTTYVKNTRAYLLSALFNSATTLDSHYTMRVNHDMYG